MFAEQQGPIGGEVDVRIGASAELAATHHTPITMEIEHDETPTVERPEHSAWIELETTDQMARVSEIPSSFGTQRGVEMQNPTSAGVIIRRIIEHCRADEHIAPLPGRDTGSVCRGAHEDPPRSSSL
jgi:hypothetical protein